MTEHLLNTMKELYLEKAKLMLQLEEEYKSIRNGREFFLKLELNPDIELAKQGAFREVEVIEAIEEIQEKIRHIDSLMIICIESEAKNLGFEFVIPQHPNCIGDVVPTQNVHFDAEGYGDIDVNDLWSIIMLKEMFDVNNVEIIKK